MAYEIYIDLSCPFTPQHSQLKTLLQDLHASTGPAALADKWITLTSSYCTPDDVSPAVGLMAAAGKNMRVVAEEVIETQSQNGHVTAKLEAHSITETASSATPFCMSCVPAQFSKDPTDAVLVHVYLHQELDKNNFSKKVQGDVTTVINKWLGKDPKPVKVFVTIYPSSPPKSASKQAAHY